MDVIELTEMLLCFDAWIDYGPFWSCDASHVEHRKAQRALNSLIDLLKKCCPRGSNGWDLQKVHELLHLNRQIHLYGAPGNFDAKVGEIFLQIYGSKFAETAQMRSRQGFIRQIADQAQTSQLISSVFDAVGVERVGARTCWQRAAKITSRQEGIPSRVLKQQETTTARILGQSDPLMSLKRRLWFMTDSTPGSSEDPVPYQIEAIATTKLATSSSGQTYAPSPIKSSFPPIVLNFIADWLDNSQIPNTTPDGWLVTAFSEGRRRDVLYRAHPDYNQEGAWYEWAMTRWASKHKRKGKVVSICDKYHDDIEDGCFPTKILAFFVVHKPGEMVLPGCLEDNRPKYGVFHCTTRERLDIDATTNERIGDSNLTVKYHLEYDDNCEIMLRIESTNIIRSPASWRNQSQGCSNRSLIQKTRKYACS